MINKKRKYAFIKLDGALGTALHVATDKWSESMGFTIKTGGEVDLIVANYYTKIAKKNRNILRKVTHLQQTKPSERPTGTCQ